jgi:hypothetical protein
MCDNLFMNIGKKRMLSDIKNVKKADAKVPCAGQETTSLLKPKT